MRTVSLATFTMLLLVSAVETGAQIPRPEEPKGTGPLPLSSAFPLAGVPVGTILPYIGPLHLLPPEWLPCDGRIVRDSASPLDGVELPNLTDQRFLMGVGATDQIGLVGGSSSIRQDGFHGHHGSTAGRIREGSGTPTRLINSGNRTFQHTHQLSIRTGGAHNHGGDNRPQFYGVRYIVRVK